MKKFLIALIIISVVLALLAGGALYAGYRLTNSLTVYPNVFVGDIHLGRLTQEQAKATLEEQGWLERSTTPLTVSTIGAQSYEIDPVESGVILSVDAAAEAAVRYGHDGSILENLISFVKCIFSPVELNSLCAKPSVDYLDMCMGALFNKVGEHMGEEEYIIDFENAQLVMIKGWNQISFDKTAFSAAIVSALEQGRTELEYDQLARELVCPDFEAIHKEYDLEPRDASYSEDGKFDVVDEVIGCKFDIEGAKKLWADTKPGETLSIPLELTLPQVTGAELRDRLFHDMLGAVTTKFTNSGEERRSNLALATSILDGIILYPGETISFNETVGVRTEEAGFKAAPAYVDGDVKDEIGGGVCQVSSTLYAATAFAFLETVERECHYFPVNYMQMGTDATVTIPDGGRSIDFKFKNNKNYPIKIVGICDDEARLLTFEIWGTLEENDYMPVCFDNSYTWQFDYKREIEPAYQDRAGYTIRLEHETYSFEDATGAGYRTLTWRIVYDQQGNVVKKEIINRKLANGDYAMDTYYQH